MQVPERLRRYAPLLALALGLALGGGLLAGVGIGRVFSLLAHARWWLSAILLLRLAQFTLTAKAWRIVSGPGAPPFGVFLSTRWLREGVNSLLPVLPVAGLLAAIRVLVRHGMALPQAVAATLADTGMELLAQIPFTVLGLALLAISHGTAAVSAWMVAGLGVLCALAAALVPAQRLGLARFAERRAQHLGWARRIEGLDSALARIQGSRVRLARAVFCHLLAWMLGGAEVWLVLRAFGHPVGAVPAFVIESLGLALRGVAFLVPGALGVQEGSFMLVCGLFGVPPAMGLALSLVKRLRDVAFGVPSLALWLRMERRGGVAPVAGGGEGSLAWQRPGTRSG
jgi:putative membrane protein